MRRPWRARVWFYKPDFYWHRWSPIWFGDDEYHWRTVVLGWNVTGQVVIALWPFRHCDTEGCWEDLPEMEGYPGWPTTMHDYQFGSPGTCL